MMLNHVAPRAHEFIGLLHGRVPERTVHHSVSVANMMAEVAERAGVTPDAAVTAGLLHDMFKATKGHELLEAADKYGIPIGPLQMEKPMLLHGAVAAEEARHVLGVSDDDVYDAIYWHTTGREGYSRMGLALYFSDFSEPLRTMPDSAEARGLLYAEGFEAALRFVADRKVAHVRAKYSVDPTTEAFHAWLGREFP